MKKIILTTAIILATGVLATSGVKLLTHKEQKVQTTLIQNPTSSGKEIASAD